MSSKTVIDLKSEAPKDLVVVIQGEQIYHYARQISNTRFGHMPSGIAYCKNAAHVQICINFCRNNDIAFRVRSGGHQHEGMCSGNNVLVIDMSEMHEIEYIDGEENQAWIPVGKQLQVVYQELEERNQIIPGGGCQSVNVGGLTLGGGWGLSTRKYGMTCDSVLEAEVVCADGKIVYASKTGEHANLWWALRGSGGGNFGIVTRFKFHLSTLKPVVTSFALIWTAPKEAKAALKKWTIMQSKTGAEELDHNLSTGCSILLAPNPEEETPNGKKGRVNTRLGGQYYGTKENLLKLLKHYFGALIPDEEGFVRLSERQYPQPPTSRSVDMEEDFALASSQMLVANFLNPTFAHDSLVPLMGKESPSSCRDRPYRILAGAPASTCDRPHPHKISSAFPREFTDEKNKALIDCIYDYFANSCYYSDVSKYISLHCLGGAVKKNIKKRVFPYHNKPYIVKTQCWWDESGNAFTDQAREEEYIQWVHELRKAMGDLVEGAFINFVDKTLVKDISTLEGRIKLLEMYYGKDDLKKLRAIKTAYDPQNIFNFQMSIPQEAK